MRMAGEGGYEAVQMRAVAEESGVALGTIYRYYSGKDEMLIAGLAGWLRRTRRRVESGSLAGDTPGDRLIFLLERSAALTQNRPTLMGALIRALGTTSPAAIEHNSRSTHNFGRWSSRRSVLIGDSMPRASPG